MLLPKRLRSSYNQLMDTIVIKELTKIYQDGKKALDSISLSLPAGEIYGFLGPNGAGKTTTVKLACGMLLPSSGSCLITGADPAREPHRVHACCGVLTEHAQMYDQLTGLENLLFYAALFGVPQDEARRRAQRWLAELALSDAGEKKLASYSTGMRQKLSLARALIHEPEVLFLDEPTSGLDPESTQKVHNVIQSLARESGVTIFLCTHQLRYAQEICTRFGLLDNGRLLADGTLKALRARISPGIRVSVQTGAGTSEFSLSAREEIPALVSRLVSEGAQIYGVSATLPSLEDIYFKLTEETAGEDRS